MILRGTVYSETLEMDTGLTVITPAAAGATPPAVCYLYHGLGSDSGGMVDSTQLTVFAEEYNVVFVMPEVGRSYYFNLRYGQRFFTWVADELPEIITRQFSVSPRREDTAVVGISMGGNGALRAAFARPERFGICCALSSGLIYMREHIERLKKMNNWTAVAKVYGPQRVVDFRCMFGDELEVAPEQQVMHWARTVAAGDIKPRVYAACGVEDPFRKFNRRFRDEANSLGLDITYEEWTGGHDPMFFNEGLRRAFAFAFGGTHAVAPRELVLPTFDDEP
ncbi:MAG: hypothetical protein LUC93_14035 [Planctomycetaceae bacterium]|nr:hypothetical protein [Planctomycetaceae bacterium]